MWRTYSPYLFHKYGKKVFRLSEDLIYSLVETKISKIDTFFLELPFKCIYLALPKSIQIKTPDNNEIDGIYVTLLKEGEFDSDLVESFDIIDKKITKTLLITGVKNNVDQNDISARDIVTGTIKLYFGEGDIFAQIKPIISAFKKQNPVAEKPYQFVENFTLFVINRANRFLRTCI